MTKWNKLKKERYVPWNKNLEGIKTSNKGQIPWNKGTKYTEQQKESYKEYWESRKGKPTWNTGLKGIQISKRKNKTMVQEYGIEKANKIKQQISLSKKLDMQNPIRREQSRLGRLKQRFNKISKSQIKLFNIIKNKYPTAILEYPFYPYIIDISIPEYKIGIEFDGIYWHSRPEQKIKDEIKEQYIESKGWELLHFNEDSLKIIEAI